MFEQWRQAKDETEELNLIPVMNLFMVLIPFLLMGAAFFHIGVIPTSTPSHTPGESDVPKTPTTVSGSLVIERDEIRVTFASTNLSEAELGALAKQWTVKNGQMPADQVQAHLREVKKQYPESTTLVVLPAGDLPYQQLVTMLDKTREFEAGVGADGKPAFKELFPVTVFSKLVKAEPSGADDPAGEAP